MRPRAPAAAPLSRRTCAPRPTCASPFPLLGTCSELAKLTLPLLVPPPLLSRRYWIVLPGSRAERMAVVAFNEWDLPGRRCAYFAPTVCRPAPHRAGETAGARRERRAIPCASQAGGSRSAPPSCCDRCALIAASPRAAASRVAESSHAAEIIEGDFPVWGHCYEELVAQ